MEVKYEGCDETFLRGKMLVLPAEGIGNVGQLAVDLIIHNAHLKCMGSLRAHHSVLPCVGNNPFAASGSISSELQIFGESDATFVVLQQRGPIALGRQATFATALANFIQAVGFGKVLMLGSLASVEGMGPIRTSASKIKCSCPEAYNLAASSWQELEDMDPHKGTPYEDQHLSPFPFFRAAKARSLPVCLLLIPVNEGDNLMDSKVLASAAADILERCMSSHPRMGDGMGWNVPPSWVVFGQQRVVY